MDAASIAAFVRDGAVILRGVISPTEVALLRDGIDAALQKPSSRAKVASDIGDPGFFWEDFCRWRDVAPLSDFVMGTQLGRVAAGLMNSSTASIYHDHILIKEPRTEARTPWHQDQPYYDVEGRQGLSFWIPVDPVPEESSLELIAGSHHGPWLLPRSFATGAAKWLPEGSLPEAPDYNAEAHRVLRWAMEPGDALAFHFLTVHGAPGMPGAGRRRVFSLRFLGDDMRWVPRPWVPSPDLGLVLGPTGDDRVAGSPLSGAWFPLLYDNGASARSVDDASPLPLLAGQSVVDLARYPVDALDSEAGRACIAELRAVFVAEGAVVLPGFLRPAALAVMAAEVAAVQHRAFVSDRGHNVYLDGGDATLPPDHPRNRRVRTVVGSVAYDDLDETRATRRPALLRQLYEWPPLLEFVRRILGRPQLHRLADPIGACTVNVFRPGDEQGWHFDESEFSTTLMLAAADSGGVFDYARALRRSDGSEAETTVAALLSGDPEAGAALLRRLPIVPGALAVFGGRAALHRVTCVGGEATRLVAVLTFCESPGESNSADVRELFWGRRLPHACAGGSTAAKC